MLPELERRTRCAGRSGRDRRAGLPRMCRQARHPVQTVWEHHPHQGQAAVGDSVQVPGWRRTPIPTRSVVIQEQQTEAGQPATVFFYRLPNHVCPCRVSTSISQLLMPKKKPELEHLLNKLDESTTALQQATQQAQTMLREAQDGAAVQRIRRSIKK